MFGRLPLATWIFLPWVIFAIYLPLDWFFLIDWLGCDYSNSLSIVMTSTVVPASVLCAFHASKRLEANRRVAYLAITIVSNLISLMVAASFTPIMG